MGLRARIAATGGRATSFTRDELRAAGRSVHTFRDFLGGLNREDVEQALHDRLRGDISPYDASGVTTRAHARLLAVEQYLLDEKNLDGKVVKFAIYAYTVAYFGLHLAVMTMSAAILWSIFSALNGLFGDLGDSGDHQVDLGGEPTEEFHVYDEDYAEEHGPDAAHEVAEIGDTAYDIDTDGADLIGDTEEAYLGNPQPTHDEEMSEIWSEEDEAFFEAGEGGWL